MIRESKIFFFLGFLLILIGLVLLFFLDNEYVQVKFTDGKDVIKIINIKKGSYLYEPLSPFKDGYTFLYWGIDNKQFDFNTSIKKDMVINSIWKKKSEIIDSAPIKTYIVSFDTMGGSKVEKIVVNNGEKVSKPVSPIKNGHVFVCWQLNGEEFNFNTIVVSDIVLTAKWKKEQNVENINEMYTVTFDSVGGSSIVNKKVSKGSLVSKPLDPVKNGFTFIGWQLNGEEFNFNTRINNNITLVAIWKEKPKVYTIKINQVDAFSPDVYLTVYENDIPIIINSISYVDGIPIVASFNGNKITVNKNDVSGENDFIITLQNGLKVTASVK